MSAQTSFCCYEDRRPLSDDAKAKKGVHIALGSVSIDAATLCCVVRYELEGREQDQSNVQKKSACMYVYSSCRNLRVEKPAGGGSLT